MRALSTMLQDLHAADQDDPAAPSYMTDITAAYEKVKELTGDVDILPLDQAVLEQRPGLQHQFAAAWEDQITDFGARRGTPSQHFRRTACRESNHKQAAGPCSG